MSKPLFGISSTVCVSFVLLAALPAAATVCVGYAFGFAFLQLALVWQYMSSKCIFQFLSYMNKDLDFGH